MFWAYSYFTGLDCFQGDFLLTTSILKYLPRFIRCKVEHRKELLKILDNISWLFFDKFLSLGVGLLVGVWVARYLGPEQFGLLNFVTAFVGLFGAFATLGLQGIMVRDIVRNPQEANVILGTGFLLRLLGGLVTFCLVVGVINLMRPEDSLTKTIVAIFGLIQILHASEVIKYWFESQVQSKFVVWVTNGVFVIIAGVKVAMILLNAPLMAFVWAAFIESCLVAVGLFLIYSKQTRTLSAWCFDIKRAKSLLLESWPLIFSGLALMIQARIDQVMLGQMVSDIEVGYYGTALRITEAAAFSSTILSQSFLPKIIEAKNKSEKFYHERLKNYYRLHFLFAISTGVPIFLFSQEIINVLFGSEYTPSGILLMLMSTRLFFAHMGAARSAFMLNESMLKFSMFTMVCGTLANIVFNFLLIPLYQGVGATIATILSFIVTIFFVDIFNKKARYNIKLMLKSIITPQRIFRGI